MAADRRTEPRDLAQPARRPRLPDAVSARQGVIHPAFQRESVGFICAAPHLHDATVAPDSAARQVHARAWIRRARQAWLLSRITRGGLARPAGGRSQYPAGGSLQAASADRRPARPVAGARSRVRGFESATRGPGYLGVVTGRRTLEVFGRQFEHVVLFDTVGVGRRLLCATTSVWLAPAGIPGMLRYQAALINLAQRREFLGPPAIDCLARIQVSVRV
jgi:hypothetical protein